MYPSIHLTRPLMSPLWSSAKSTAKSHSPSELNRDLIICNDLNYDKFTSICQNNNIFEKLLPIAIILHDLKSVARLIYYYFCFMATAINSLKLFGSLFLILIISYNHIFGMLERNGPKIVGIIISRFIALCKNSLT